MRHLTFSFPLRAAAAALLAFTAGCNRDGVKVYKVDSSDVIVTTPPPVVATAPAMPGGMPASMPGGLPAPDNSGLPKLKYTLPAGWKEKPLTQLRVASFELADNGKTVDVSVIPLGGMSGDTANVNRWRGQVGLPPVDDTELKKAVEPVQVGDQSADLYDIAGTSPGSGDATRIVGTILHGNDTTWYFKMMGDAELAEANKPAFIAFLKSVTFEQPDGSAVPSAMDASQLPASHPPIPGMSGMVPATAPSGDKPMWTVPADWKEGELTQFLVAKYLIQGPADATAAVNVSVLDGNGGGLLANLNRWRTQLSQPPINDTDVAGLPTVDVSGAKATLIDFPGTDARTGKYARLVGLVLPLNGQTWFYKLMGEPELVGKQKDALIKFAQSAQYPAK